jgi:hypothetical protein
MNTFIIITNETGTYEQQVSDKYFELVTDTKVRATIKPNKELSRVYNEDCEATLVFDCHAFVGENKEEVTCHLTRERYWEEGEDFDLDYELECEMKDLQSGEIDINDPRDKQGRKYKAQIIEHSTLIKQVCIGEPRLMKPTVKYFE